MGYDRDATWRALFGTLEVFRSAATVVAARLGVAYPAQIDDDVTAYLRELRELGRRRTAKLRNRKFWSIVNVDTAE